jgi:hypothetical protein
VRENCRKQSKKWVLGDFVPKEAELSKYRQSFMVTVMPDRVIAICDIGGTDIGITEVGAWIAPAVDTAVTVAAEAADISTPVNTIFYLTFVLPYDDLLLDSKLTL